MKKEIENLYGKKIAPKTEKKILKNKKEVEILDGKDFTPEIEKHILKNKKKMSKKELEEYNLVLHDIKLYPCYSPIGCSESYKDIGYTIVRISDDKIKHFWLNGYIHINGDILKIINKDYEEILDNTLHGGSTCGPGGFDCAHLGDYIIVGRYKKGDKYRNYEYVKKNIINAIDAILKKE
jgi:hypothetical protein